MATETILLISSMLITLILLAILIATSIRLGNPPVKPSRIKSDIMKIKDQIGEK